MNRRALFEFYSVTSLLIPLAGIVVWTGSGMLLRLIPAGLRCMEPAVYLMVFACCAAVFPRQFHFALVNQVSRRRQYQAFLFSLPLPCLGAAVLNTALGQLLASQYGYTSLFFELYHGMFLRGAGGMMQVRPPALFWALSVLWNFLVLLLVCLIGNVAGQYLYVTRGRGLFGRLLPPLVAGGAVLGGMALWVLLLRGGLWADCGLAAVLAGAFSACGGWFQRFVVTDGGAPSRLFHRREQAPPTDGGV